VPGYSKIVQQVQSATLLVWQIKCVQHSKKMLINSVFPVAQGCAAKTNDDKLLVLKEK
jgi:hypothetical protein